MESPSRDLLRQLSELGLPSPLGISGCARTARRLARGLPASDSIWLDALVHARRLTHFQAVEIEAERGSQLLVAGKYLLLRRRHSDAVLPAYEALDRHTRHRVLLLRGHPLAGHETTAAQLAQVVRSLSSCRELVPFVPLETHDDHHGQVLISPLPAGESVDKLLVRRGRFPEEVVLGIGRDLAFQLARTESLACHGDLRLSNLWLCNGGRGIVINWALLNSLRPAISMHVGLPLEVLDGMAPERLRDGQPATTASDLYAFGCALWQLLAGRPPFLVADPLGKMMSHRTLAIPEIRSIAPDVSEAVSNLIGRLVEKDPSRRPASFEEVHSLLVSPRRARIRVRSFSQSFSSISPQSHPTLRSAPPSASRSPRLPRLAAAMVLSLAIVAAAWFRENLGLPGLLRASANAVMEFRPDPMSVSATSAGMASRSSAPQHAASASPHPGALPNPDANGAVTLTADHEYNGATLRSNQGLIVAGTREQPATIRIQKIPLILEAESIRLANVRIVVASFSEAGAAPVQLDAAEVTLENCWIEQPPAHAPRSIVNWDCSAFDSPRAGRLHVRDCVLLSQGGVFDITSAVTSIFFENVYREGPGPLLQLAAGARSGLQVPVMMNACSFRGSGPLIRLTGDQLARSGRLSVQGAESVVELAQGNAMIELAQQHLSVDWQQHVEIAAQGLLVQQQAVLVGVTLRGQGADSGTILEVNTGSMRIDGVLSGEFHFESEAANARVSRAVVDAMPVRYSTRPPGADMARLPRVFESAAASVRAHR
jgi:serine/threonine-protein kinase